MKYSKTFVWENKMIEKKIKYIDLHCHPYKQYFDNPESIIKEAYDEGIKKIFLVGTEISNCYESIELAKKFNHAYSIIGIHPNDSINENDLNELEQIVKDNLDKVVGIGEVGIDLHYENSPSKATQEYFFKKQIEMAIKYNLALIVHSRDSAQETYNILKEYKEKNTDLKIIIHTYSYDLFWLEKFLNLGCYISYSGIVTFKNAKPMKENAIKTPLNRIFYETDTPFLTPHPFRGKMNHPKYAKLVADHIAELKEIDIEEFNQNIEQNLKDVFGDKIK